MTTSKPNQGATKRPHKPPMVKWAVAVPRPELDRLQKTADLLGKTSAALARELITAFNNGQIKLPTNPHVKKVYS